MDMERNLKQAGAYDEAQKHAAHKKKWIFLTILVTFVALHLAYPVYHLATNINALFGVTGITDGSKFARLMAPIATYFLDLVGYYPWSPRDMGFACPLPSPATYPCAMRYYILDTLVGLFRTQPTDAAVLSALPLVLPPLVAAVVTFMLGKETNKYNATPNIYGNARFATEEDIGRMEAENLVGLKKGKLMLLGVFNGQYIRLCETLSTLLLAPPGAGKSVGFIAPSIVNMDGASLLIHDLKPELHTMTSGYRGKLGPVYMLKWGTTDKPNGELVDDLEKHTYNPDLFLKDEKGNPIRDPETGRLKTRPIFYPSWNPLSPLSMPVDPSQRGLYIDRLANVLCPDPSGGGDKFWTEKARAAIVGLAQYLIAKVDLGNYNNIPAQWHGMEPSFPMLVDWFTYAQMNATEGDDPMREVFRQALDEARQANETAIRSGRTPPYPDRAITELTALMQAPDKTRGSILSTLDGAMLPFKQETVRQRTSKSDFSFADLRGVPSEKAKAREAEKKKKDPSYRITYAPEDYQPLTIYICVSLQDARALSVISGIFVESANNYLVSYAPNMTDDQGRRLGPYAFGFLLDEAPQMPKLQQTIIDGPATGRSKKVFYTIVGQDFAQFEAKYSKSDVETLISTTAIKVVLAQNNDTAAKRISEMAGKLTYTKVSLSDKPAGEKLPPIIKDFVPKKKSKSESMEGVELLKPSFLMSMPKDQHVLLVQNNMNTPIKCSTPNHFREKPRTLWTRFAKKRDRFLYPDLAERIFNERTKMGPLPAPPMPMAMMDKAIADIERAKQVAEARKSPKIMLIATPSDIQALRRDEFGEPMARGSEYAVVEVELMEDGPDFCSIAEGAAIHVTSDLATLQKLVAGQRFLVFDQKTLERDINSPLEQAGLPRLIPELGEFLMSRAQAINEQPAPDIYVLGQDGGASLRVAADPGLITPAYTLHWIADIMTFVMGIEEQVRLIRMVS